MCLSFLLPPSLPSLLSLSFSLQCTMRISKAVGYMAKSSSPCPLLCFHSVFFPRGNYVTNFSNSLPEDIHHVFTKVWGYIIQTVVHLASVALQHILEVFPSPFILLKGCLVATCGSSTGASAAQLGLSATDRLLKGFGRIKSRVLHVLLDSNKHMPNVYSLLQL